MISKEELDMYLKAYQEGHPIISDEEYDKLLEEYLSANPNAVRPYLRQKQTDAVYRLTGTLPKVYGVQTPMRENLKTYEEWLHRKNIPSSANIIVQAKYDGISVVIDCDNNRAFTRGDYEEGDSVDVTELFDIDNIIKTKYVDKSTNAIKFECIMSNRIFNSNINDGRYLTARDMCQASVTSRNKEMTRLLTLMPLRTLSNGDETVCQHMIENKNAFKTNAYDFKQIQSFVETLLFNGATTYSKSMISNNIDKYAVDGVVVSVIDDNGYITDEVAIKIINEKTTTKLIDVKYQFGKTGRITPVAILEPTQVLNGTRTVTNVTLSTLGRVVDMNLRQNDTVEIMYNIVPYLMNSHHDGYVSINIPNKCPKCGSDLNLNNLALVRCTNPDCIGTRIGSIIRYCKSMGMIGLGEGIIEKLAEADMLYDISDLYNLNVDSISKLNGFGETSAKAIVETIQSASTNVRVAKWLGSLPFLDMSIKTWTLILDTVFGVDAMVVSNNIIRYINSEPDEFINEINSHCILGVGPATLRTVNEYWRRNIDMMRKIVKHVTFDVTTKTNNSNHIANVTFTGFRDDELVKRMNEFGYDYVDYSKKTDILVIPNPMYSNKKTANVNRVMTKTEFEKLLDEKR